MTYTDQDIEKFAGKKVFVTCDSFDDEAEPPAYLVAKMRQFFIFVFESTAPPKALVQIARAEKIKDIKEVKTKMSFDYDEAALFAESGLKAGGSSYTMYNLSGTPNQTYQSTPPPADHYPHICPNCGRPSYNSAMSGKVDCSANCGA
jgi:hypothetical protein